MTHALFEVSWEVCNKIGGIHTVLTSKAKTAVARYGDDYVTIGPWLLADAEKRDLLFEEEPGFAEFGDACRQLGLPVRVGRWRIPGRPRCILVEFSSLYDRKDDLLADLWKHFQVDSIEGDWDYVEPVLFGLAAAQVVQEWWERHLAPLHKRAIVHAHEWMTGSALLHLKRHSPAIATVFTTHSTTLGRALSALGESPHDDELDDRSPAELARAHHLTAKHSLESTAARECDVFTTVSGVTAKESVWFLGREPKPLLFNGLDLDVVDELAGPLDDRAAIRRQLEQLARRFLGLVDLRDAAFLCISGRYELHNKGIDLLLDACARLDRRAGRPIVVWALVPAGNSGVRSEVRERLEAPDPAQLQDPIGIATHHLFDEENDAIRTRCAELGLDNSTGSRVKIVHVPIYVRPGDGLFEREYEAVLSGMDIGVFPSFYEPWGYTPQESLAVGVPTITSDFAGFGRWALDHGFGPEHGISVVERVRKTYDEAADHLAQLIEAEIGRPHQDLEALRGTCRATAGKTSWHDLYVHYEDAYHRADAAIAERSARGIPVSRRPRPIVAFDTKVGTTPRLRWFDVASSLPGPLRPLERLARNFFWCWDPEAPRLFADLDPDGWERAAHNPIRFLKRAGPELLAERAGDRSYLKRLERVMARFDAYLAARVARLPVGGDDAAFSTRHPVAYFCAEYGLHESLPIYSGGLGVLAGDHLKAASDVNLPLVAIGLFYRFGYMTQRLSASGEQLAIDFENDPAELAIDPVNARDGTRLEITLPLPGRDLTLRAWRVTVGRVPLYLLDANVPANREEDRDITRHLYGGDHEMRIQQLIVLGRGGARLLDELGIDPAAYHMNEGHAAFLSLERMAKLVFEKGLTFEAARELVRATTAFTTHTPVPAGHDRFSEELMRRYFQDVAEWAGVPWDRFMRLGRADATTQDEFNMTYLALSFAAWANGVSQLHGEVSRTLLQPFWPSLLEQEVPVDAITNGVHLPTWTSPRISSLLGAVERPVRARDFADGADRVDPAQLWNARKTLKHDLAETARARIRRAFVQRSDSPLLLSRIVDGLDEDALWIGFARRFAPYKRAGLLYKDLERLKRLCDDQERPVRILVAGKAHPRDQYGKDILKGIAELARRDGLVGRVIFLENYAIDLARSLVQGVDVWLNTPTRLLEASGTSGMKAAANGGLNLSIADGWWPEAADGTNGWTIAAERFYEDQELQDQFDADALYRLLEEEIVPLYFDRDAQGVPASWIERSQRSLKTVPPVFDSERMVQEYLDGVYAVLGRNFFAMRSDKARAQGIASEAQRIRKGFAGIRLLEARVTDLSRFHAGDTISASLTVDLGALTAGDVEVELVLGRAAGDGPERLADLLAVPLTPSGTPEGAVETFSGSHEMIYSGRYAQGLRVRPRRLSSSPSSLRDLVLWA